MSRRFDDEITLGGPGTSQDESAATLPPSSTPRSANLAARTPLRRFEPGSVVGGRYRLVALLGKGGMGEVYRAEDLTLDQPVALKFLPESVAAEGPALAQFHNELRIARQVSHKNVCRLYDLGEADGRRFLTMEYVDGEDLASLLRRIGRIPQDKAIQLARQLCAGLSAAHEKGVLHRDLKPANVMIDGNGDVRLTDFGIAVAAGDAGATLAGTPQYMAPEQLNGAPASVASDIYALGLILFELFTGKRTHSAKSVAEVLEFHNSGVVPAPTTVVRDLEPAIERVIMRCLDRDPAKRPRSALAVAATLPGHDPIAAALAAGETLSPELLSAAAETDAMPVARVLVMAASFVVGIALFLGLSTSFSIPSSLLLPKPTPVLLDRADQLFEQLGYTASPADKAYGTRMWRNYYDWIVSTFPNRYERRFENPEPILLWYRTSLRALMPVGTFVSDFDPPPIASGMLRAYFETGGRLIEFAASLPIFDPGDGTEPDPDWKPLFNAAGLSQDAFEPVSPQWAPLGFADTRRAWKGLYDGRAELPVRIEAAAYRGKPLAFRVIGPWDEAGATGTPSRTTRQSIGRLLSVLLLLGFFVGATLVAAHNVRTSRADYRSAKRLAFVVIGSGAFVWLMGPHGSALDVEIALFGRNLAYLLAYSALVWAAYISVEPYARRYWPDGLLGWSRLFAGHIRDPRVGRDLLRGLVIAALFMAMELGFKFFDIARGQEVALYGREVGSLAHSTSVFEQWASSALDALFGALASAFVFVLSRRLFKRELFAGLAAVIVMATVNSNGLAIGGSWGQTLSIAIRSVLLVYTTMRAGLLVFVVASLVSDVVGDVPLTIHPGAWYSTPALITLAMLGGLLIFAVYAARAGQPLLGSARETPDSLREPSRAAF